MLPPLHQLSLHGAALPTDALMDDPELQGAIDIFTKIWAEASNEASLTPVARAQEMCRTLDVLRRISTTFVPANFYKHYAMHLNIPNANRWSDRDPAKTYAELRRYCQMVHSPETAAAAAEAALGSFPKGFDEVLWLAAHGADYWSTICALMTRLARPTQDDPPFWVPMLGGGQSTAASHWNRLIDALGGQGAVDARTNDVDNPELAQAYGAVARLDNVAAMQLFETTFARGITPLSRETVALSLHGGQIDPLRELVNAEVAHIAALQAAGAPFLDTRHLQNIIRNGVQAMARNHMRPLNSTTTPFQDIATLSQQMSNQPHVHSLVFVGALQGLPSADTLPAYVNAYFQPGHPTARELLNLLTRFLGERLARFRDWFPLANDAKFRALVQALPDGTIDSAMRDRLLALASGTQNGWVTDETGPGWEMRRMHSVIAMFGGQRFGLSTVCRAMKDTFFHLQILHGTAAEHEALVTERVQVLTQLVALLPSACAPGQPNELPVVHRSASSVIQDMYDRLLSHYVRIDGIAVPDNAEFFVKAFGDTIRVFADAGIELGRRPEGAVFDPRSVDDFGGTERFKRTLSESIHAPAVFDSPEHKGRVEAKLQFAGKLLDLIP